MMKSLKARARSLRKPLSIARIVVGLYFAAEAMNKISHGWLVSGADFVRTVQTYQAARVGGFYHVFVTGTVLPHARLFALLVTLGECVVAVSLVLGLLTRLGALTALWLNLNFMLLKGLTSPSGTIDRLFLLAALLFLVTAAGSTWGMDGRFCTAFSRLPVVRWFAGSPKGTGCWMKNGHAMQQGVPTEVPAASLTSRQNSTSTWVARPIQ
jgi:uncharacterized membrane protein YphA (DoxX/SURF4 family)